MEKSPEAFRTISEVAEFLETPAHVLRFWESRFPQIRPVKRAGGRRYYRPADVALLTGIKRLLHDEGMTIRGVQKILREQGVRHVSGMADDSSTEDDDAALEAALASSSGQPSAKPELPPAEAESAQVIALQSALSERSAKVQDGSSPSADAGEGGDTKDSLAPTQAATPATPPAAAPTRLVPPAAQTPKPARPPAADDGIPDLFSRMIASSQSEPTEDAKAADASMHDSTEQVAGTAPEKTGSAPDSLTPSAEHDEAPMAVWAEPDQEKAPGTGAEGASATGDQGPEDQAQEPPMLRVTRIGATPTPPPSPPPAPAEAARTAQAAPTTPDIDLPLATLAARLRKTVAGELSASERTEITVIRARARSLRDRLATAVRPGH